MSTMNSRDDGNIIAGIRSMLRKSIDVWRRPSLTAGTSQLPELVRKAKGEIAPVGVGSSLVLSFGGVLQQATTTEIGTFLPDADIRKNDELRYGERKWLVVSLAKYDHVLYAALAEAK